MPSEQGQKEEGKDGDKKKPKSKPRQLLDKVLANRHFAWIRPKLNKNDGKPVIRTALSVRFPTHTLPGDSAQPARWRWP